MADNDNNLKELVAEVAAAYFSTVHVNPSDIGAVIAQIATSLNAVGSQAVPAQDEPDVTAAADSVAKVTPQQARKSITPDKLISFEDGKGYKTLKRHLAIRGLTPAQYREKWGLPGDYPMVSANYSAARSNFAKTLGLGQLRKSATAVPAAASSPAKRAPKKAATTQAARAATPTGRKPGRPRKTAAPVPS